MPLLAIQGVLRTFPVVDVDGLSKYEIHILPQVYLVYFQLLFLKPSEA